MKIFKRFILGILIISVGASVYAQALLNSENDPLVYLRTLPAPNVLLILDTSSSMRLSINGNYNVRGNDNQGTEGELLWFANAASRDVQDPTNRMKVLKDAIREVVQNVEGVNFGIGRYNGFTKIYTYVGGYDVTFDGKLTMFEYCYDDDYNDTNPMDKNDCILLDACYLAAWSLDTYNKKGNVACSSNPYPSELRAVTMSLPHGDPALMGDVQPKRYAFNKKSKPIAGAVETVYHLVNETYDPEKNMFYPGTYKDVNIAGYGDIRHYLNDIATQTFVCGNPAVSGMRMRVVDSQKVPIADIRNPYLDDPMTPADEATILPRVMQLTGKWYEEGSIQPEGCTPLNHSMGDARDYFEDVVIPRDDAYPDIQACRENYIVLVTDGKASAGEDGAHLVAQDLLLNSGIPTFVIALLLTEADLAEIDMIADGGDDGVFNDSSGAVPANSKQEVKEAFEEIMSKISAQIDVMAPPVIHSVYTNPYDDSQAEYAGDNQASSADMVVPFFQFPSWRGHLLATHLYYIEYNPRIPDDPSTPEDDRWLNSAYDDKGPDYRMDPQDKEPSDMWDAGYLISWAKAPIIDTTNDTYINMDDYENPAADPKEYPLNPAFNTPDNRQVYTATKTATGYDLVKFDSTLVDKASRLGLNDADWPAHWLAKAQADYTRREYVSLDEYADVVINFIRGKKPLLDDLDDDGDGNIYEYLRDVAGDISYTEKQWILGSSVIAVAAVIGPPSGMYKRKWFKDENIKEGEQPFSEYVQEFADRPRIVIWGSNNGVMHCFAMDDIAAGTTFGPEASPYTAPYDYKKGEEIWAFVPGDPDVMQKLKYLVWDSNGDGIHDDQFYIRTESPRDPGGIYEWIHWYFVDGPVRFSNLFIDTDGDGLREWRTYVIVGEGRGGRFYYCFDFTNPFAPTLEWVFPNTPGTLANMGVSVSTPAIAHQNIPSTDEYRWLAFLGAGWDPDDDPATERGQHIYGLNMLTGSVVYDYDNPYTADKGTKKACVPASVVVVNSEIGGDYIDDKVFVGDTDGRLWKIDLQTEDIYLRLDFENEYQPITSSVSAASAHSSGGAWDVIFVGTGGDSRIPFDSEPEHSIVGFVDDGSGFEFVSSDPTIAPSASGDNELPSGITLDADPATFTPSKFVFAHILIDPHEQMDVQPSTNIVEREKTTKFQTFFTVFNRGVNPCRAGTTRLIEVDFELDKTNNTISRAALPSGGLYGSIEQGSGKTTGTFISDGLVIVPSGDKVNIYGSPTPPPAPIATRTVVHVLSWKVITD